MNHGSQSICLDALLLKEKPPAHHELAADKHKQNIKGNIPLQNWCKGNINN